MTFDEAIDITVNAFARTGPNGAEIQVYQDNIYHTDELVFHFQYADRYRKVWVSEALLIDNQCEQLEMHGLVQGEQFTVIAAALNAGYANVDELYAHDLQVKRFEWSEAESNTYRIEIHPEAQIIVFRHREFKQQESS